MTKSDTKTQEINENHTNPYTLKMMYIEKAQPAAPSPRDSVSEITNVGIIRQLTSGCIANTTCIFDCSINHASSASKKLKLESSASNMIHTSVTRSVFWTIK
jgi:hypothetical protein